MLALSLLAVGLMAWQVLRHQKPAAATLTITAGRMNAERTRLVQALASEAAAHGLTLRVVETQGSEDAMDRLADGESGLNLALVQGGLAVESLERDILRQVTSLHDEPLHLLVRGDELASQVDEHGLTALRGRRIAISNRGSGTYRISQEILAFAGLDEGRFEAVEQSTNDVLAEPNEPLPDAILSVSLLPSRAVESLIQKHDYRLVGLPYAASFALWRPREHRSTGIIHRDVRPATIPAMTYDREPRVPAKDVETLATRSFARGAEGSFG